MDSLTDYKNFLSNQNRLDDASHIDQIIQNHGASVAAPRDGFDFDGETPVNRSHQSGSQSIASSHNGGAVRQGVISKLVNATNSGNSSFSINGRPVQMGTGSGAFSRREEANYRFNHVGEATSVNSIHSPIKAIAGKQSSANRAMHRGIVTATSVSQQSYIPSASSTLRSYASTQTASSMIRSYRSTQSPGSLMRSYGSPFSSISDSTNFASSASSFSSGYSAPTPSVSQTIRSEPGMASSVWYHH